MKKIYPKYVKMRKIHRTYPFSLPFTNMKKTFFVPLFIVGMLFLHQGFFFLSHSKIHYTEICAKIRTITQNWSISVKETRVWQHDLCEIVDPFSSIFRDLIIFLVMAWFLSTFSFSNLCSDVIFLNSRLTFHNPGKKVKGGGIAGIQVKFWYDIHDIFVWKSRISTEIEAFSSFLHRFKPWNTRFFRVKSKFRH